MRTIFKTILEFKYLIIFWYFFQVVGGYYIGRKFANCLQNEIGDSLSLQKLLLDYDYTILEDIQYNIRLHFSELNHQIFLVIAVYLFILIFLKIIFYNILNNSKVSFKVGLRFVIISLVGYITIIGFISLIWIKWWFNDPILLVEQIGSDKEIVMRAFFNVLLSLLVLFFVQIFAISLRWNCMNFSLFHAIKKTSKSFVSHFGSLVGVGFKFWGFQFVLFSISLMATCKIGMTSYFTVILIGLLQQLFCWLKIAFHVAFSLQIKSV